MIKNLILITLTYLIIYSIGCQPTAIISYEILDNLDIDSNIALADTGKGYGHYYIQIDDKAYEPRFLGLYLTDNIDYNNPRWIGNSEELINKHGLYNFKLLFIVLEERI